LTVNHELREVFGGRTDATDQLAASSTTEAIGLSGQGGSHSNESSDYGNTRSQLVAMLKSHTDAIATCADLQEACIQQLAANQEAAALVLSQFGNKFEPNERVP
jgi:hypothetical protein